MCVVNVTSRTYQYEIKMVDDDSSQKHENTLICTDVSHPVRKVYQNEHVFMKSADLL
jgi:hypothetical protein